MRKRESVRAEGERSVCGGGSVLERENESERGVSEKKCVRYRETENNM